MSVPAVAIKSNGSSELRIVEVFGPTVQGEGPTVGCAAYFLRLAGCNLTCVWCDTPFSWDPKRVDPQRPPVSVEVDAILRQLDPRDEDPDLPVPSCRRLVITGGEPLLQAAGLKDLCRRLRSLGWFLEVETSGTVAPGPLSAFVDRFTVSPKLAHSAVVGRARLRWSVLNAFSGIPHASFKFVVVDVQDLEEIDYLLQRLHRSVDPARIMVMAEGTTAETVLSRSRGLVDAVAGRGWGLTPRWHILLWGDEPGR